MRVLLFSLIFLCSSLPHIAFAELLPEQVAVIANSKSASSVRIAKHYLSARGIPKENLLRVTLPVVETIERELYDEQLVEPIRKQLTKKGLAGNVTTLVSTYGIPLRVKAPKQNNTDKQIQLDAIARLNKARAILKEITKLAETLAPENTSNEEPRTTKQLPKDPIKADKARVRESRDAISKAVLRVKLLPTGKTRDNNLRKLSSLVLEYGGLRALEQNLQQKSDKESEHSSNTRKEIRKEIQSGLGLLRALEQNPTRQNRARAYSVTKRILGTVGVLARANAELESRKYKDADASIDSELVLLWWNRDMYRLPGRLPNPFFHGFLADNTTLPLPVLMVSRIDAPTETAALEIINGALEAEKKGLKGKVYLDSRGLRFKQGDLFAAWDQNLGDLAALFRNNTSYTVRFDDKEKLFKKAPQAAVYVGWYQLRNYEDVFSFPRGAIGYHIASEEAVSIRNPDEHGWCKNMLERGAAATVGAVAEPYLDSFPLPQEFFAFLLSGNYSLAEAYFLSTPYISWRMILFGDPLYNPWRGKNLTTFDDLTLRTERDKLLKKFPLPPSKPPFIDPDTARAKIADNQEKLNQRVNIFFETLEKRLLSNKEGNKLSTN